ncbi:MAG TPA: hypothetical protein VJL36_00365 [Candidatus Paceibacterota bacterium]
MIRNLVFIFLIGGLSFGFILIARNQPSGNQFPPVPDNQTAEIIKPKIEKLIWTPATTTAPWSTRDAAATFIWQDKLWLTGGLNGRQAIANNVPYWELPHFNDVWSTVDGSNWREETVRAAWPARRSMSIIPFANKLWLLGGWSPISGYGSDIWTSLDGVEWIKEKNQAIFPPREGQAVVEFKNQLWLTGGVEFDKRQTYNDVWTSVDGLNWTLATTTAPWSSRYDHAVAVFHNKLWLSGGVALGGEGKSDLWSSADGTTWTLETDQAPWGKRHGHALVDWPAPLGSGKQNKLWLISGWNTEANDGANDVWSSVDGKNWMKEEPAPWRGREDHAAVIFKNDLWLFSGMDGDWRWRNDIWRGQLVETEE